MFIKQTRNRWECQSTNGFYSLLKANTLVLFILAAVFL